MPSDIDSDLPVSHFLADGWASFAATILPSIGGDEHARGGGSGNRMMPRVAGDARRALAHGN
jgi:hypothetical protein